MNYYVRVFCTNVEVPDLASIQTWLRESGSVAVIDEPDHAIEAAEAGESRKPILDLATSEWEQVAVAYRAEKLPILAECHRDDGLMRKEIARFQELIGESQGSPSRRHIWQHLAATRFMIICQLPSSDMEEDGFDANSEFVLYFVEHCGGVVQADGEGFYSGARMIVPLKEVG
jgi:hypothetical protein